MARKNRIIRSFKVLLLDKQRSGNQTKKDDIGTASFMLGEKIKETGLRLENIRLETV
jgi:hypothetical protein